MKDKYKVIKPVLGKIIFLVIFLVILIISLCNTNRLSLFTKLFNNFLFNMSNLSLVLYFLSLLAIIIYNAVYLIMYFIGYKKDEFSTLDKKTDIIQYIFKCIALIFTFLMYIITPCTVVGDSMNKTLQTKDRVITINLFYSPQIDDVIIFNAVANTEIKNADEDFYIKRVIAKENDEIKYESGKIFVNGKDSGKVNAFQFDVIVESIGKSSADTEFIVPAGKVLVFGDNRPNSCDSRYFGFIDSKDIYGKVILRIYPYFGNIGKDIVE